MYLPLIVGCRAWAQRYNAAMKDGKYPRGISFGPMDPPFSALEPKVGFDNNNVNVWFASASDDDSGTGRGHRVFALSDSPLVVELDAATLDTIGHSNTTGPLAGGAGSCAHGLTDVSAGSTGVLLNYMAVPDGPAAKVNLTVMRTGPLEEPKSTRTLRGFGTAQLPIMDWPCVFEFVRFVFFCGCCIVGALVRARAAALSWKIVWGMSMLGCGGVVVDDTPWPVAIHARQQ